MTGAELTATASDMSVVSLVCLVMLAGCVFFASLGFPWQWAVAAGVLFLFVNGNPTSAIVVVALAVTLHAYAPHVLVWLESLDIGREQTTRSEYRAKYDRTSRNPGNRKDRTYSEQDFSFEDFFESASRAQQDRPKQPAGPTPETVLGLSSGFTKKDLETARRKLAKQFHPDLHRSAPPKTQKKMAEKMRAVNAAYETLKPQVA